MIKRVPKYCVYQIVGWGLFLVVSWMAGLGGIGSIFVTVVSGLLVSHILRYIIIRYGWLSLPVRKAWPRLLAGAVAASIVMGSIQKMYGYFLTGEVYEGLWDLSIYVIDLLFLIGPWTAIYYFYHYAQRIQGDGSKNRKLELRVKEMEERSRETGTDMATMMDSLQRIQASIEEDPVRCREEITEFSKLLREGYLKTG